MRHVQGCIFGAVAGGAMLAVVCSQSAYATSIPVYNNTGPGSPSFALDESESELASATGSAVPPSIDVFWEVTSTEVAGPSEYTYWYQLYVPAGLNDYVDLLAVGASPTYISSVGFQGSGVTIIHPAIAAWRFMLNYKSVAPNYGPGNVYGNWLEYTSPDAPVSGTGTASDTGGPSPWSDGPGYTGGQPIPVPGPPGTPVPDGGLTAMMLSGALLGFSVLRKSVQA